MCIIFVLVHYLNRKIHIEIQVSCSRVKVTLTNKENFFARSITMEVLSNEASYSIFETCTTKRSRVLLFDTIWRALPKPPQRRQGPDPRPLWLLVGTPSAFGPELAYRLRVAQPTLMDVARYFWYTLILLYMFVYYIFMTSPLWLAVGPQSI